MRGGRVVRRSASLRSVEGLEVHGKVVRGRTGLVAGLPLVRLSIIFLLLEQALVLENEEQQKLREEGQDVVLMAAVEGASRGQVFVLEGGGEEFEVSGAADLLPVGPLLVLDGGEEGREGRRESLMRWWSRDR